PFPTRRSSDLASAAQLAIGAHRGGLCGRCLTPAVAAPAFHYAVVPQAAGMRGAGFHRDEASRGRAAGGRRLTELIQIPALDDPVVPQGAGVVLPRRDLHELAAGRLPHRPVPSPAIDRAIGSHRARMPVAECELGVIAPVLPYSKKPPFGGRTPALPVAVIP